ncbi:hypothetical protein ACQKWADRAFT_284464 [Trichoderma austrokoningii]
MKLLLIALLLFGLCTLVHATGWDDFANNLATDLAPILALFGDQTTKQYLSESITVLDHYIFSIAPIGILTAVVSAIRVCGSPSLRAFIGRSQEGGGDAEAELCSSTSRDVCELYNNGGIARVFGRPKILEVVHDPSKSADDTAGIYPCREYVRRRPDEWTRHDNESSVVDTSTFDESVFDVAVADESVANIFAPNLSLNIGIKRHSTVVSWIVAVGGTVLQLGVLVFAIIVTYRLKWLKNGSPPDPYACPMAIVGSLVEWGGMFLCAYLVGKTSRKQVFYRNRQSLNRQAKSSSIYWVQPGGQVLGDQVFDAFCYSDHDQPLLQYISSWKKPSRSSDSDLALWAAVVTTVTGFIIQFVGLRGIHSAISVAQLGAMLAMSVVRSALRMQRLKPNDNFLRRCPDEVTGHELDWLAMHIGRDDAPADSARPRRLLWRFCGARNDTRTLVKDLSALANDLDVAGKLLAYRTRLGQLTLPQNSWAANPAQQFDSEMVEVREVAQHLASALKSTVNRIFSKSFKFQDEWKEHTSMYWSFACDVASISSIESCKSLSQHTLHLQLTRGSLESPWKLRNKLELEGLLGLWLWSLKSDPEVEKLRDRLTVSRATEIPIRRIVSTKEDIGETGLNIWLGSEMPSFEAISVNPASESCDPSDVQYQGKETRLFGWYTTEPSQRNASVPFKVWSASTDSSLLSLCAQEVFGSFLVSIFDAIDAVEDVDIQETPYVHLESKLVSEVTQLFTDARLGSREDALLCVLPPLISRLRMPPTEKILAKAKRRANEHRRRGEWTKAEAMLKWVWNICIMAQPHAGDNDSHNPADMLVQRAATALGELYRWAMTVSDLKKFSSDGIKWLLARKSRGQALSVAVVKIIDRYVDIENRVDGRVQNEGDDDNGLTSELLRLTLPSRLTMTTDEKNTSLDSAAKLGWSEVVSALLDLGANPDYKKGSKAVLILAAASNSIDAVEELIHWGASPTTKDDYGMTPLIHASSKGHDGVVKVLLDDPRVDPNIGDHYYQTPLSAAAWNGRAAVAQLLLDTGRISELDRPLQNTAQKGYPAVAQLLLNTGKITDLYTPLRDAARNGHKAVLLLLLNTGKITDLNTPLWDAAENGHEAVAQVLLNTGKITDLYTPLRDAARNGHKAVVQLLLNTGKIDVNIKMQKKRTLLMHAAETGHEAVVQLLLGTGKVDIDAKDDDGKTALMHAKENGHEAVVELLQKHGQQ